jgi:hypothetical protein
MATVAIVIMPAAAIRRRAKAIMVSIRLIPACEFLLRLSIRVER